MIFCQYNYLNNIAVRCGKQIVQEIDSKKSTFTWNILPLATFDQTPICRIFGRRTIVPEKSA